MSRQSAFASCMPPKIIDEVSVVMPTPAYPDLREAIVLVTGGANGIGNAIVRAFHSQGAHVFFCDTDAAGGRSLAKELGARAEFTQVDLTREIQIVRWVKRVAAQGKPIRALVNNAARDPRMELETMTAKHWDDLFDTNLRAYFLMARETAPHMPDGAGA